MADKMFRRFLKLREAGAVEQARQVERELQEKADELFKKVQQKLANTLNYIRETGWKVDFQGRQEEENSTAKVVGRFCYINVSKQLAGTENKKNFEIVLSLRNSGFLVIFDGDISSPAYRNLDSCVERVVEFLARQNWDKQ
ncbi:MAG: hypothetical protein OXR68_03455 [Alphaproteobacteria bacterium]|nr:hypothetical protein [Alphaproteobacteria bacterium]MDD9919663.1 hypothetical protein [Alphaproteobacteria bacterium]